MVSLRAENPMKWKSVLFFALFIGMLRLISSLDTGGRENRQLVTPGVGNSSPSGGTPTVRRSYPRRQDNPRTTNDESNDQPVGYFGTVTLTVRNLENGNRYTLDGDLSGLELSRLYFPRGGWIDFLGCELEDDMTGYCTDEEGRDWYILGER